MKPTMILLRATHDNICDGATMNKGRMPQRSTPNSRERGRWRRHQAANRRAAAGLAVGQGEVEGCDGELQERAGYT